MKLKAFSVIFWGLLTMTACSSPSEPSPSPLPVTEPSMPLARRGPANVEAIEIYQLDAQPVEVNVIARGHLPDGCSSIDQINQTRTGSNFQITIDSLHQDDDACPNISVRFEEVIALDVLGLPAGIYVVDVNGLQGTFTLRTDNIPDQENAVVSGRVWNDRCEITQAQEDSAADPPAGCVHGENGTLLANGLIESDETGLSGILVNLGEGTCPSAGLATTITDAEGVYLFGGLKAGTYCISVDAFDDQNVPSVPSGKWTFPQSIPEGTTAVQLAAGESLLDVNFGWQEQSVPSFFLPVEEPCTDKAIFKDDVTIPDNTVIAAGGTFTKTWRLQNIGSCTWDENYGVVLEQGEAMSAQSPISLTVSVAPGDEVDLSVKLIAPLTPGTYRAEWKLKNPDGFLFGIGPGSDRAFWVEIVVEDS